VPQNNERLAVDQGDDLPIDLDTPPQDVAEERQRPLLFLRSRRDVLLVIGAGGALGSLARWGVGALVPWTSDTFPWATFIENVSGGFALGVLMVFVLDVWPPHRYLRPFLCVGFLGGYTTFSTYMLETRHLLADDQIATAFTYLGGSLMAGLAAVWVGIASARLAALGSQRRRQRRRQSEQPSSRLVDDQVRNP
jgi:CrcB protein